ncbi:MalT transcriptional regulator family protein [Nocardiopsis baichengensis]|uniref:hypothetical protein n=1 Tax=Nocardiopsis baichengensis TaxID=280240 RepID=UPI000345B6C4|nr:hypothetical protein [Nocardiopsis baichengensis]
MSATDNTSHGNQGGAHVQAGRIDTVVVQGALEEAARTVEPQWDVSRVLRGRFVNHDEGLAYTGRVYRETALQGRPGNLFVVAPRGAGKSAFSVEAAYHLRSLYTGSVSGSASGQETEAGGERTRGVWGLYVDLDEQRAAAGGDAEEHAHLADALASLLGDLGVPAERMPAGLAERSEEFRKATGREPCIVIVEGIASASEAGLFTVGTGSMVILTGRTELPGLRRRGVPVLRLPALRTEHALALLCGFDGPEEHLKRLVEADPDGAQALVDRCGGLPQALQIAGAHLAMRPEETPASVVERLDAAGAGLPGELDRLVEPEDGDPRLDEVIALGFGDLRSEAARQLYTALGEVPGRRVHEGLAAALLGSRRQAREALGELVRACLMAAEGGGRYRWEPLIRHDAHGRAQARPDAERRRAAERAVDWFTTALARADREMGGGRSRATREHGDRAAAREAQVPFGGEKAGAEAQEWVAEAVDAVPALMAVAVETGRDQDALVMAESCWYVVHEHRRGSVGAEIFRYAGEIARLGQNPVAVHRMDNYLARVLVEGGEADRAAAVLHEVLEPPEASGEERPAPRERAVLLETRALAHAERGEYGAAEADFQERRRIDIELGNRRAQVIDGYQIGGLRLRVGDPTEARRELEAARAAVAEELGGDGRSDDWRTLAAKIEVRLGEVYLRADEPEAASRTGKAALELFAEEGEEGRAVWSADALALMARAEACLGGTDKARAYATAAARLYRRHHQTESARGLADLIG